MFENLGVCQGDCPDNVLFGYTFEALRRYVTQAAEGTSYVACLQKQSLCVQRPALCVGLC